MQSLYRKTLLKVTESKFFEWFVSRVLSYIRFSTYYTKLKGKDFYKAYDLLSTGDIILCADDKKLTTALIGGKFSHAALCVGNFWTPKETLEMTRDNCIRGSLFDIFKESDRVVILRCKDWDEMYIKQVIAKAESFYEKRIPYDYSFGLGIKALYCSELIYQSDFEKRLDVSLEDVAGLGRPYISPTGLYRATNVKVVYDSTYDL